MEAHSRVAEADLADALQPHDELRSKFETTDRAGDHDDAERGQGPQRARRHDVARVLRLAGHLVDGVAPRRRGRQVTRDK